MDPFYGSISSPLWVMANAALAGVINMIPGAQAASTDLYRGQHALMVEAGRPAIELDILRNNAIAWGWW